MKRYLYQLYVMGWEDRYTPPMPRVLAEKTAKQANKEEQRRYGCRAVKTSARKTGYVTKDTSPRGLEAWYPLWNEGSKAWKR